MTVLRRPSAAVLALALAAASLPVVRPATAATPGDLGSWGDAWGEEVAPPPPARAPAPPPAAAPVAAAQVPAAGPAGPRPAEIGGWGDAWGDQTVPAPAPRPRALPVAAPAPAPAAIAPAAGPFPRAAEIGTWSDAWGEDATQTSPAAPSRPATRSAAAEPPPRPDVAGDDGAEPQPARPAAKAKKAAPAPEGEPPVDLTADQIVHDRELGIVTAVGRVEIVQSGRTLVADNVSYNLKQDIISAAGNITLMEPTGDIVTAEYFELTGDFKDGVARQIRILLSDNSRMAAATATRVGGDRTDLDKGVYTACEPCRKRPDRRPLWEAKAERIIHNQADQSIEYRDAWIEFAGVPVMYTPYLSHPDPTVKRKSGFLVPTAGLSSNLGASLTTPYYWAIAANQDATFTPRFLFPSATTTETPGLVESNNNILQRMVLAGEHRWRGMDGEMLSEASLTSDKHTGKLRGHLDATGKFDLDRTWRAGYQIQRASDATYTSLYNFPINARRPWLTTRPYVEGFGRTNYAMAEGFAFQSLRSIDEPDQSPLVLPHAVYSHVGQPGDKGGYWTFDADTLAYARTEGTDAARMVTRTAWQRPFIGRSGDITTLTTSLRADAYKSDFTTAGAESGTSGRVVPQVAADWRMPFVRNSPTFTQTVEPLAMVAFSPNGGNPAKIPNEDSAGFDPDEINILRADRMPGLDRVEGGARGAYGLRWSGYPARGGYIAAQAAQGWRAHADSTYGPGSGFAGNLSDYVGRLDVSPNANLAFLNRFRLDKDNLELRRNETTVSAGPPLLRASLSYLMFERTDETSETFNRRHAIGASLSAAITQYWSAYGTIAYDLTDGAGPVGWTARLAYSDECFAFLTNLRKIYVHDADVLAGYELTFNVVFKTLGDVPLNVF
ncbi:LPS-assembly protein LptD [Magnetospirillum sp. UT-4]|uniref:LPS-assembly protein LptD n=1 Tax=Magnetospirillum sp. UT-4 TaxID=2681467 RepID=UPI0013824F4B|nr:LPS assembly protein LptD [Magnetospirillum sp. UT-4]CAA7614659.1 putative exported protein required for envelope biosynthesis and integrity [Magnetospirillum sp. UT-4]